jgi:hypothetical protein
VATSIRIPFTSTSSGLLRFFWWSATRKECQLPIGAQAGRKARNPARGTQRFVGRGAPATPRDCASVRRTGAATSGRGPEVSKIGDQGVVVASVKRRRPRLPLPAGRLRVHTRLRQHAASHQARLCTARRSAAGAPQFVARRTPVAAHLSLSRRLGLRRIRQSLRRRRARVAKSRRLGSVPLVEAAQALQRRRAGSHRGRAGGSLGACAAQSTR